MKLIKWIKICLKARELSKKFSSPFVHVKVRIVDNPERLCIDMGIRCRACGSGVKLSFSPSYTIRHGEVEGKRAHAELRKKLESCFKIDYPEDCDEALSLNLIRAVHES